MRAVAGALMVVSTFGACGRVGFDARGDAAQAPIDDGATDAPATGAVGPRWIKRVGSASIAIGIDGEDGEVAVVQRFSSTFSADDGIALTGAGFQSSAFIRYNADGSVERAVSLDATGFCDLREVAVDGTDSIVAGLTIGTMTIPAYGACSIATNRQDPLAIRIAADGTQTVVAHWTASGSNAQGWGITQLANGSFVLNGIYGGDLMTDMALPTAQADPNAFVARTDGTVTGAAWSRALTAAVEVHAGPIDSSGQSTCMVGAHRGPVTLLGVAVPHVGGYDAWVIRVDDSGAASFVRGIGSAGNEPSFSNDSSVVALPDDGCAIGIEAPGDVTIDAATYLASDGIGLLVRLDSTGNVVTAARLPSAPFLAGVGDRLIGALSVSAPLTIGGQVFTPDGADIVVVELAGGVPERLLGVIGGAGDQSVDKIGAIGPDAVAVSGTSTGALSFGTSAFDSGAATVRVVAALGI